MLEVFKGLGLGRCGVKFWYGEETWETHYSWREWHKQMNGGREMLRQMEKLQYLQIGNDCMFGGQMEWGRGGTPVPS